MKENLLLANLFALAAISCGLNAVQGQPVLQFSAGSYSVTENEPFATLRVSRTGTTEVPVSVHYISSNATALAGMDYAEVSGMLEFGSGQTNQTISVPILNDTEIEPQETFNVELKNPGGGAVLGALTNAAVRITDNDKGLQFEFSSYRVNEDAGSVLIGVKRADDGVNPITVDYATSNGTAIGEADYTSVTGTLSFAEGQRIQLFTVPILNDGLKEPTESFRITLSNPTGITLGFSTNANVTIVDNDPGVRFQLDHYWSTTYRPAESAGLQMVKVIRGNDRNLAPFTVSFATSDLTAKAGEDYTATNGTLSFAQGEMLKTFTVAIAPDGLVEDDETFRVTLSNPVGAELSATPFVTVTILDSTGFEPHRFQSIAMQPDRTLRLGLFGQTNPGYRSFFDLYPLETSSDLVHWTPWVTLVRTNASNQPLSLTGVETANGMSGFYRTPTNHIITPYPAPTGPFATGVSWRLLTDPTRRNRYHSSTNDSFMVSIWYPASSPTGRLPAPIWDERLWPFWPYWASNSWQEAPGAASGGPFPVILYSHGYNNNRGSCSEKGPYFASHGYVVIAIDHADADGTIFPNGSYFFSGTDTGLDVAGVQIRIRDLGVALAELERWSLDDPILAGRLDLTKVAVMGFSFGGVTAGEMARTNPRCKVAVTLDAMPYGSVPRLDELGIQKPLLQINAADNSGEHIYNRNDRDAIYFRLSNSVHLTMGGEDYYWTRGTESESAAAREAARTVNTCALSFLNKHLKGLDDHLLDTQPAGFPRITNWKSK